MYIPHTSVNLVWLGPDWRRREIIWIKEATSCVLLRHLWCHFEGSRDMERHHHTSRLHKREHPPIRRDALGAKMGAQMRTAANYFMYALGQQISDGFCLDTLVTTTDIEHPSWQAVSEMEEGDRPLEINCKAKKLGN
jgi:hypothetical protein